MWIMYKGGFLSAVAARNRADRLVVRARDRESLEQLFARDRIIDTWDTDYPHRVVVDRAEWEATVLEIAQGIDYGNFKDAATESRGKRWHNALMRVWSAMLDVADVSGTAYAWGDDPERWSQWAEYAAEDSSEELDELEGNEPLHLHMLTDSELEELERNGWL